MLSLSKPEALRDRPMLQITDLSFNAWGRRFFEAANARIPDGAKVGPGRTQRNGQDHPFQTHPRRTVAASAGEITTPRSGRVATVAQEHAATSVPLLDTVLTADVERAGLLAELETRGAQSGSARSTPG